MLINRKLLLDTLTSVKPGLDMKETLEQSDCFIFTDDRVSTYNDINSVSAPLAIGAKGAVSAKQLYALLQKTPGMDIEVWVEDSEVVVKGNTGMTARVDIAENIRLPIYEMPPANDDLWESLDESIKEKLRFCLQTVSKNMARPTLCAIHWKRNFLESSDNYQITRCTINTSLPEGVEVLLPSKSVSELIKFDPAFFQIADGWVHFKSLDAVIFSCCLFENGYPDISTAIEAESSTPVKFSPRLPKILERAIILAKRDSIGDPVVDVSIKDNQLTVTAGDGSERFVESCDVLCAADFEFRINPDFLRKLLKDDARADIIKVSLGFWGLRFDGPDVIRCIVLSDLVSRNE